MAGPIKTCALLGRFAEHTVGETAAALLPQLGGTAGYNKNKVEGSSPFTGLDSNGDIVTLVEKAQAVVGELKAVRAVLKDGTLQAKPGAMTSHQADMESDSIFRFECWPGF